MILLALLAATLTLPNPRLTPGATLPVTKAEVCTPGYAGRVRNVPESRKRAAYARYHVKPSGRYAKAKSGKHVWKSDYEVDHLISLELGGSNDITNLWPESYLGEWNAHDKDALENTLHAMVCHGELPLVDAQHVIATDWIAGYKKYVH